MIYLFIIRFFLWRSPRIWKSKKIVRSGSMLPALIFHNRSFTTIRSFSKLRTNQSHKALHARASAKKQNEIQTWNTMIIAQLVSLSHHVASSFKIEQGIQILFSKEIAWNIDLCNLIFQRRAKGISGERVRIHGHSWGLDSNTSTLVISYVYETYTKRQGISAALLLIACAATLFPSFFCVTFLVHCFTTTC